VPQSQIQAFQGEISAGTSGRFCTSAAAHVPAAGTHGEKYAQQGRSRSE